MSKNKIITTLIVCAILFSLLAAYLIYRYMTPSRGTMYVFNSDYELGTQVTEDMLVPIQVDSTIFVGGSKGSIETQFVTPYDYASVVRAGDSLRMDVSEGMPLTTAMLSVSGGSTVEMNMKSDTVAVTVPIDPTSGVTNELKEGARVNIYYTNGAVTTLIQQNKRILEVFRSEGAVVAAAIEEDIYESMELINAVSTGSIYFGLVDATGYQAAEGEDPYYSTPLTPSDQELYNQLLTDVETMQNQSEEAVSNSLNDEPETEEQSESETLESNALFSLEDE